MAAQPHCLLLQGQLLSMSILLCPKVLTWVLDIILIPSVVCPNPGSNGGQQHL